MDAALEWQGYFFLEIQRVRIHGPQGVMTDGQRFWIGHRHAIWRNEGHIIRKEGCLVAIAALVSQDLQQGGGFTGIGPGGDHVG